MTQNNSVQPVISTTVLSWNRADLLRLTLESYAATVSVPFELFIVDNASTDESRGVIEDFCSKADYARAIFLPENIGGEAINKGLELSRGRLLHISENDIEYLPGWSEKVVDLFESFPKLGQLSLFGLVTTDREIGGVQSGYLVHSKGRIVYETTKNITTTCVMRREIFFEHGVSIGNIDMPTGSFLFPADARLSQDVRTAGFTVAWADHYLANNLGHSVEEFKKREKYYRENYEGKPWIKEPLEKKILDWEKRPRPKRDSMIFPGEKTSPEKSERTEECPEPRLWSMFDGWTAEVETLEFLYSLVRLVKPVFILETGTWHGYSAEAMGLALRDNGRGSITSLSTDPESHEAASNRIRKRGLGDIVSVLNESSLQYDCKNAIDFILLDSDLSIRWKEFYHFLPGLKPGAMVISTTSAASIKPFAAVREGVKKLIRAGYLEGFFLSTPRGLSVCRYTGKRMSPVEKLFVKF